MREINGSNQTRSCPRVSLYSIRGRLTGDLRTVFGNDTAREMLGYGPDTFNFEQQHHLEFATLKDLVGMAQL